MHKAKSSFLKLNRARPAIIELAIGILYKNIGPLQ